MRSNPGWKGIHCRDKHFNSWKTFVNYGCKRVYSFWFRLPSKKFWPNHSNVPSGANIIKLFTVISYEFS
jgi:hypothetical protein